MSFALGAKSNRHLRTCNEPLQRIVRVAIELTDTDFSVIEGMRTLLTQQHYVDTGKSWTLDSKHLTGDAVDIYPWVGGQTDHSEEYYRRIAKAMFTAAQQLRIPVSWGGFWKSPKQDMPHWELIK